MGWKGKQYKVRLPKDREVYPVYDLDLYHHTSDGSYTVSAPWEDTKEFSGRWEAMNYIRRKFGDIGVNVHEPSKDGSGWVLSERIRQKTTEPAYYVEVPAKQQAPSVVYAGRGLERKNPGRKEKYEAVNSYSLKPGRIYYTPIGDKYHKVKYLGGTGRYYDGYPVVRWEWLTGPKRGKTDESYSFAFFQDVGTTKSGFSREKRYHVEYYDAGDWYKLKSYRGGSALLGWNAQVAKWRKEYANSASSAPALRMVDDEGNVYREYKNGGISRNPVAAASIMGGVGAGIGFQIGKTLWADLAKRHGDRTKNPARSASQYGAAQAVLSGRSRLMPPDVAQELIEQTPKSLRRRYSRELASRRNPEDDFISLPVPVKSVGPRKVVYIETFKNGVLKDIGKYYVNPKELAEELKRNGFVITGTRKLDKGGNAMVMRVIEGVRGRKRARSNPVGPGRRALMPTGNSDGEVLDVDLTPIPGGAGPPKPRRRPVSEIPPLSDWGGPVRSMNPLRYQPGDQVKVKASHRAWPGATGTVTRGSEYPFPMARGVRHPVYGVRIQGLHQATLLNEEDLELAGRRGRERNPGKGGAGLDGWSLVGVNKLDNAKSIFRGYGTKRSADADKRYMKREQPAYRWYVMRGRDVEKFSRLHPYRRPKPGRKLNPGRMSVSDWGQIAFDAGKEASLRDELHAVSSASRFEKWYRSINRPERGSGITKPYLVKSFNAGWRAGIRRPNPDSYPDSETEAADLYETFHGVPSTKVTEVEEPEQYHEWLTELGSLQEIKVETVSGYAATIDFSGDAVILSSDESGRQLYLVGGNQTLDLESLHMDSKQWRKDLMEIGRVKELTYQTKKKFDSLKTIDYYHALGEETGVMPTLVYDTLNDSLKLAGGQYQIKPEGIVN